MKRRTFQGPKVLLWSLALFLISAPLMMIEGASFDGVGSFRTRSALTPSLDGEGYIGDSATTTFTGEEFPGSGGKLGSFFWTGDINGDGIKDLCIGASDAPGKPETGKEFTGFLYIWYGNASGLPGVIDLETDPPDILIKGARNGSYILNSMDVADLDGDGHLDLILGIPLQDTCGRVYVLWGKDGGWPKEIELIDPGRLSPNGDPYGFLRTDECLIIAGHIAPVPLPDGNYYVGNGVSSADLDRDGRSELVFSSPGSNHIVILWGKDSRTELGTELTVIEDQDETGRFGESFVIEDLDDDGWPDAVVAAPHGSNRTISKYECGTVHIIFNLSRARGSELIWTSEISDTLIWGSDPYDRLGQKVAVEDVNNDRYPDMIIGCPDADGPSNTRSNAGAIYVINGGMRAKFPLQLSAETGSDRVIHGSMGEGHGYPGDSVGGSFSIGDIDSDNGKELVLGIPTGIDDKGVATGVVVGYETNVVFTSVSKTVDLKTSSPRFSFWGGTYLDVLGYRVHTGDINGDEAEEVFASAPSGDGVGDVRVNAGEVFMLTGSNMSISDLRFTGGPVRNGKILPSEGYLFLNLTFRHSVDPLKINDIQISLAPGKIDGFLTWVEGFFSYSGPSMISLDEKNCSMTYFGGTARLSFRISIGWFSDLGRPWDVHVEISDGIGNSVVRRYPSFLPLNNLVELQDQVSISAHGRPVISGEWLRPGSLLEIGTFGLKFSDSGGRDVSGTGFLMELYRDGSLVDSQPYLGHETVLMDDLPNEPEVFYEVKASFDEEPPYEDFPGMGPTIIGKIDLMLKVDNVVPLKPQDLRLVPDEGRISFFDDDSIWSAEWKGELGPERDGNTSGIRGYMQRIDDGEWSDVMSRGGLWGSYYNGAEFHQYKYGQVNENIDFGTDDWGVWGPDVNELTPSEFSVRWHGWFRADTSRPYQFSISGDGVAKFVLGNELLIDWSDISTARNSPPRFIDEGTYLPLMIHYYNQDPPDGSPSSYISFNYINELGLSVPVDRDLLHYPGNGTTFEVPGSESFNISIASVDWVETSSAPVSLQGYIDEGAPIFDLSDIRGWYGSTEPELSVGLRDPMIGIHQGSGIDISSVRYRIKERTEDAFSDWMSGDPDVSILTEGQEAPGKILYNTTLSLDAGWRGSMQWRVADIVGNQAQSSIIDIGVDRIGPLFELLSPNLQVAQKEGEIGFIVKVIDRPGSGIDPLSLDWRYRIDGEWLDWVHLNISGSGEEIIFDVSGSFPVGNNQVQFRGADNVGNLGYSETYKVLTEPIVLNNPPVAVIKVPLPGTVIRIGSPLLLDGSDSYDDGEGAFEELRFTWISNIDGYLGSGEEISVYLSNLGEHRIRLFVDDGTPGHNVSVEVNVTVREGDGGGGNNTDDDISQDESDLLRPMIAGAIAILVLLVVVVLVIRRNNRIREDQTRLDYVERTDDDYEYDDRLEEEERSLGIYVEGDDRTEQEIHREREDLYGYE
ncbi:MAG: PA14 domain-containing protein [Thermoplasmatota archaeon]